MNFQKLIPDLNTVSNEKDKLVLKSLTNLNQNLQHKLFLVKFISYPYDQNQLQPIREFQEN